MKYLKANRGESGRGRYVYTKGDKPINLTGVTTILSESSKPFLITWAAKAGYQDMLDFEGDNLKKEIRRILKEKDYKHERIRKYSTDKGQLAHDYVDQFIKDYIETGEYKRQSIEDEEVRNSVERFYDWSIEKKVEFLEPDSSIYHPKYLYAGSYDFICRIDGEVFLGDFKSSKEIDVTYPAQCAAYIKGREAIELEEELTHYDIAGSIVVKSTLAKEDVVRFKKSSTGKMKGETIPAFEIKISRSIDLDFQFFFSCLFQYKYKKGKEIMEWNKLELVDPLLNTEYSDEDYPLENN